MSLNIGYLKLPHDEFYKQVEEKYPEAFARTGLFKHEKATIHTNYWDTSFPYDNASFWLDDLIRIIKEGSKQVGKPGKLPEEPAIIIEPDENSADSIRIFENDYWIYREEYYYRKGIYEEVIAELGAN